MFVIALAARGAGATQAAATTTVKDKVYTKEQAARGQALFEKVCSKCHALDDKASTLEGPSLAGEDFLKRWDGKPVFDFAFGIKVKMPPDGSVTMDDDSTADAVAFILESNTFPAGDKPLTTGESSRTVMFVTK